MNAPDGDPLNVPDGDPLKAPDGDRLRHAVVAVFAFALLLILVTLQSYGLVAAVRGKSEKNLTVRWCSPSFRDFALAITTGNCKKYEIAESSSNGIGCIYLPAEQQRDWLTGTIVGLAAALAIQFIDTVLLRCSKSWRFRGVKMQRPWLTMFGGILMLVLLISFGVSYSSRLPPGVTDVVWVYRKEPGADVGRVCQVNLKSPGLRGMIIGWTDGVFASWGDSYHGSLLHHRSRTMR